MTKVLIAGAAGFLGSHLVDHHLALGDTVIGVDNLCTGNLKNLEEARQSENFSFIEADVSDSITYPTGCELVYHLASPASPPKYMQLAMQTMLVNTTGTIQLLEYSRANNARFLFASTSEIYGDPEVHPQPESYWGNVNTIGPRSVYDEAKRFGETLVAHYVRENLVDAVIIRIFNTYGPRMDPHDGRVVSNFIREMITNQPVTMYGDGTRTRSFCYVSDLIRGIQLAAASSHSGPINLGNPNEMSLAELARTIADILQVEPSITHQPVPEDDPQRRKPDIEKAQKILGWYPEIDIRFGIQETAAWMISILEI